MKKDKICFTIICPDCKDRTQNVFNGKKEAVKYLIKKGYTIREVMKVIGAKSPGTVQYYLK